MTSDPIRLLDDPQTAASLRGDLAQANAAVVEGLDHGAGLAALKAAIASEAAAASGASGGAGVLGKIAIAVLLVGGGAAAIWAATRTDANEAEPSVKAASTVGEARRAPDPEPKPAIVPPIVEAPTTVSDVEDEPAPVPTPEEDDAAEVASPEPVAKVQRPRAKQGAPADAADRVLREARMIADAREALAARPGVALSLAHRAAREFPQGQLVEEREAITIRALVKLGRTDAARARAERFLARYGTGPHAESVRSAIAASAP